MPEGQTLLVLAEDQQMALVDAFGTERPESLPQESTTKTLATMGLGRHKMMNEAAPPVMAAQNCANKVVLVIRDEAQSVVPRKKALNWTLFICGAEPHTRRSLP
jgi:hypothetical protein